MKLVLLGFVAGMVLISAAAPAAELVLLKGPEIERTLDGKTVEGTHNGALWHQEFQKSGTTIYVSNGHTDTGSWQVRGDAFCSNWPPSETWDCYSISTDGSAINFIPPGKGEGWPARFIK